MKARIIFHLTAVLVLAAAVAAAQSTPQTATSASTVSTHDRAPSVAQIAMVSEFTLRKSGNVFVLDRDPASGHDGIGSSKRQHAEKKPQAQPNPTYKDNACEGTNLTLEEKDKAASKPDNDSKSKKVEYKDNED